MQAAQLAQRIFMVVDAQVQRQIVFVAMDAQARPTACRACRRRRLRRRPSRPAGARPDVSPGCCANASAVASITRWPGQHVAGHAETVAHQMPAPIDAGRTGERRSPRPRAGSTCSWRCARPSSPATSAAMASAAPCPCASRSSAGRAVQRIHQRLRRDRTDTTPGVHTQGADGEEAAGDRHTEMPVVVARQNRPGHGFVSLDCRGSVRDRQGRLPASRVQGRIRCNYLVEHTPVDRTRQQRGKQPTV